MMPCEDHAERCVGKLCTQHIILMAEDLPRGFGFQGFCQCRRPPKHFITPHNSTDPIQMPQDVESGRGMFPLARLRLCRFYPYEQ